MKIEPKSYTSPHVEPSINKKRQNAPAAQDTYKFNSPPPAHDFKTAPPLCKKNSPKMTQAVSQSVFREIRSYGLTALTSVYCFLPQAPALAGNIALRAAPFLAPALPILAPCVMIASGAVMVIGVGQIAWKFLTTELKKIISEVASKVKEEVIAVAKQSADLIRKMIDYISSSEMGKDIAKISRGVYRAISIVCQTIASTVALFFHCIGQLLDWVGLVAEKIDNFFRKKNSPTSDDPRGSKPQDILPMYTIRSTDVKPSLGRVGTPLLPPRRHSLPDLRQPLPISFPEKV